MSTTETSKSAWELRDCSSYFSRFTCLLPYSTNFDSLSLLDAFFRLLLRSLTLRLICLSHSLTHWLACFLAN